MLSLFLFIMSSLPAYQCTLLSSLYTTVPCCPLCLMISFHHRCPVRKKHTLQLTQLYFFIQAPWPPSSSITTMTIQHGINPFITHYLYSTTSTPLPLYHYLYTTTSIPLPLLHYLYSTTSIPLLRYL